MDNSEITVNAPKKRINPTSIHIPCSYPIGSEENPYNPAGNICTHEEFNTSFVKNVDF